MLEWDKLRQQSSTVPALSVEPFDTAAEAIASAEDDELLIIDAPAHANRGTLEIAQAATLIVQPSRCEHRRSAAGRAPVPRTGRCRHSA